jgi:raffinose/stachyose/melibiose transport system substrate-binding protein
MKKTIAVVCMLLTVFALFAAGKSEQTSATKLQFFSWYATETDTFEAQFLDLVAKTVPGVTVEIEPVVWDQMHALLQTRIAANTIPDLLDLKGQDVAKYGSTGGLLELTGQSWLENIPAAARENLKIEGKEYGMPYSALFQGVFYNKDLFKKYGVAIPKTYDELMKAAAVFKAAGVTPFAAHFADNWNIGNMTMQFAMSEVFIDNPNWGKDLYAGKATFEGSEGYRRVFQHVKDIHDNSWSDVFSVDFGMATARFGMGEAAMFISGTWANRNFREFPELDYGIFPFPGKTAGAKLIFEPNHTWAIGATTKNAEQTLAVLAAVAEDKDLAKLFTDEAGAYSLLNGVIPSEPYPCDSEIDRYKSDNLIVDVSIGNNQIKWAYQEEYSRYIAEWILGRTSLEDALKAATAFKSQLPQ